jgi:hypothetical protein
MHFRVLSKFQAIDACKTARRTKPGKAAVSVESAFTQKKVALSERSASLRGHFYG